jgi:hypothetical protein
MVHNGGNCVPGMDLTDLMKDSGLIPTQKDVWEGNINEYADAMRKAPGESGAWDWNRTATDPREPMIKDLNGNIIAGHHRFIAAKLAGVQIPEGVIKVIPGYGGRVPRPWGNVTVHPGFR